MKEIIRWARREAVLSAAALLAAGSMALVRPDREYAGYVDFRTLGLLFCLMAVMAGFQKLGVFERAGRLLVRRASSPRQTAAVLVGLCFFSSMAVTNDVALITFVPFALTVLAMAGLEDMAVAVVVLQTLGANLGSMLTPFGNPQNLYLYSGSGMTAGEFAGLMLPYWGLSLALLAACLFFVGRGPALRLALEPALRQAPSPHKKEAGRQESQRQPPMGSISPAILPPSSRSGIQIQVLRISKRESACCPNWRPMSAAPPRPPPYPPLPERSGQRAQR